MKKQRGSASACRRRDGFTLVELLVVVAIIGLLSTMAVVSLNGIRERARDTKRISDIDAIQKSMELVKSEMGGYDSSGCPINKVVSECATAKLSTYLPTLKNIIDPLWTVTCNTDALCKGLGCNYTFGADLTKDRYQVFFNLEKGVATYTDSGCYVLTEKGISQIK
ncbi:prepilin-type N-terminal cleavage/methylation domain-containing protein [Candidatus Falkowbacteria bacterium]|nr:prepilin-type N-terminal cleavage/methylation domain-containing protein [Candidatus Falkowbacteria bacterium]